MPTGNGKPLRDDPWVVDHESFLELASASVDGEVTGDERSVLDGHLAECPTCRRFVADSDRLRRRGRLRSIDEDPSATDPEPILAALHRNDPRPVRSLVRRAGVSGLVAATLLAVVGLVISQRPTPAVPDPTVVATRAVSTGERSFDEDRVTVPVGTTVEWSNEGTDHHLLVQEGDHTTVRTALDPGAVQDVTFHEPGVYDVHCLLHPEMAATLTVAS